MDEQKATDAGPEAPTKRRGRPPGRSVTDRELIERLARQNDALAARLKEVEEQQAVPDVPETPKEILPGSLIIVGKDQSTGQPIYRKKPWTRRDVETKYPKVTFTPNWSVPITFQNVSYQLEAGKETEVPSIIRDIYVDRMKIQHMDYASLFPAPSPDTVYRINEAARKAPGTRVFSGLHHIGVGLNVHTPDEVEAAGEDKTA